MRQKHILIWSTDISNLLDGNASGIAVQLYFWAQTFTNQDWRVVTFTNHKSFSKEGISFRHLRNLGKLNIIYEWVVLFWQLLVLHPKLVISRGESRSQYAIAVLSRLFSVKYVFFAASDSNFETNKKISGGKYNTILYKKAIANINYFVVQNQYQKSTLFNNYHKQSILLLNIWGHYNESVCGQHPITDVIWVANLRPLKRAEWMLNAAKKMPEYDFTIVGGSSIEPLEAEYYRIIEEVANKIPNLHFLGKKSFAETNAIISQSRLLCCTSTYEGFPNTFLQAWSNDIPVVSTVNPSDLITNKNLGAFVHNEEEFQDQVKKILQETTLYNKMTNSIHNYFKANHDCDNIYAQLMKWLQIE